MIQVEYCNAESNSCYSLPPTQSLGTALSARTSLSPAALAFIWYDLVGQCLDADASVSLCSLACAYLAPQIRDVNPNQMTNALYHCMTSPAHDHIEPGGIFERSLHVAVLEVTHLQVLEIRPRITRDNRNGRWEKRKKKRYHRSTIYRAYQFEYIICSGLAADFAEEY